MLIGWFVQRTVSNLVTVAMLAVGLVVVAHTTGRVTMARKLITVGNTGNNTGTVLATVGTTPSALAPQQAASTPATGGALAVVAPNGTATNTWQLAGSPSTAKQAVGGVGPAPSPGTVGYAALQCIALGGATLATMQAAVTAVGCKGKHPIMPLLRWLAKNRGYTFMCTNGVVTLGSQGGAQPAAQ